MGIGTIILALLCLPLGRLLGWYVTRNWTHLTVNPKVTFFPKLCPLCLSNDVNEAADEKSPDRQAKNYVVAQRLEHWTALLPYCSRCTVRLDSGRALAILAGAVCAAGALILLPPNSINLSLFCYILFGYPAYAVIVPLRKGMLFKSDGKDLITVAIRNSECYDAWIKVNKQKQA